MKRLMVSLSLVFSCLFCTGVFAQQSNWYERLPACPCKNPDQNGVILGDGWAKDKGNINKYHKGAAVSYRSYPAVQTEAGKSGQQCCYDGSGNLITAGRGAGTPDKVSTCKGENKAGGMIIKLSRLVGHLKKDVKPWKKLMNESSDGWQKYNALWPPNNGNNCKPM